MEEPFFSFVTGEGFSSLFGEREDEGKAVLWIVRECGQSQCGLRPHVVSQELGEYRMNSPRHSPMPGTHLHT